MLYPKYKHLSDLLYIITKMVRFNLAIFSLFVMNALAFSRLPKYDRSEFKGLKMVTDGIIVGGGRIGTFLWEGNGKNDIMLADRSLSIPDGSGPIYLCTRNNDLEAIIAKTPSNRLVDLVFLQNGILTPYLKSKGLQENTQALIYFAVSSKGAGEQKEPRNYFPLQQND